MNGSRRLATAAGLAAVLAGAAGLPAAAAPTAPPPVVAAATPTAGPVDLIPCTRSLQVGDRSAPEGTRVEETDPLYTYVSFPVTSAGCPVGSTVSWSVHGLTASPTYDFLPGAGTLTFPAGSHATRWLTVRVVPDGSPGDTEVYRVQLHSPTGAVVSDGVGLGWIGNDDSVCKAPPGWISQPPYYPDYHCSE